jgi:hypothetical protein
VNVDIHDAPDVVVVDCYGHDYVEEHVVNIDDTIYAFVFTERLKSHYEEFDLGLFMDQHAHSNAIWQYSRDRRAAALLESPINRCYLHPRSLERRFPVVFTHQQHLIDRGAPYVRLMFGTNWVGVYNTDEAETVAGHVSTKSRLVSFIGNITHRNRDAYAFRRQVAEHVMARGDVDCFGKGIREVASKREAIAPYCFSVAMENAASDDYFSEKLIDCILLKTVPIYYGAPGLSKLFDERGILSFRTIEELKGHLESISRQRYEQLLTAANENLRTVVKSEWFSAQSLFTRVARELHRRQPARRRRGLIHDKVLRRLERWKDRALMRLGPG